MGFAVSISKERASATLPFAATAALAIVGGGLLAAVVAVAPTRHPVWASSYLVLVVGVIQFALGLCQALLATKPPAATLLTLEWLALNAGNAGVIGGTLFNATLWVVAGSVLMVIALFLFFYGTWQARDRMLSWLYRLLLLLVLMSIVIGISISASQV